MVFVVCEVVGICRVMSSVEGVIKGLCCCVCGGVVVYGRVVLCVC